MSIPRRCICPDRGVTADLKKLQRREFARYGRSMDGMPPLEFNRGSDGELVIFDGVTRAPRVAKFLPGAVVVVGVTGTLRSPVGGLPIVGEKI